MQKISSVIIAIFLLSGTGTIVIAQNDSIVKINRVKYQQMRNKLDEYETVKLTFVIESGENVQGTAYYAGDTLKIIEKIYLSSSGHRLMQYYFEKGSLFFALETDQPAEEVVGLSIKGNNKTGTTVSGKGGLTESRYYFYEDKLIRWYDKEGKEQDMQSATGAAMGISLTMDAYKMKERLQR